MYKETSWTFKNDGERTGVLKGRHKGGKQTNKQTNKKMCLLSFLEKKKSSVGQSRKNF